MGKALYIATNILGEEESPAKEVVQELHEMNIVMGMLFPLYMELHDPERFAALQRALQPAEEPEEAAEVEEAGEEDPEEETNEENNEPEEEEEEGE